MAEKKMGDLPPSYINLGYDRDPVTGPSAPKFNEGSSFQGDDGIPAPGPSAPQLNQFSSFEGDVYYPVPGPSKSKFNESSSFEGALSDLERSIIQPMGIIQASSESVIQPSSEPGPVPKPLVYNPPSLVFEEIYEACIKYVDDHFCYGKRFVKRMKLLDIINKVVFHYKLESFGEKRESALQTCPYKGEAIDGPRNGTEPNPWNIAASPPQLFKAGSVKMVIPHSTTVHECSKCNGRGKVTCSSCNGRGSKRCWSCMGSGRKNGRACSFCSGNGRDTCWSCFGSGKNTCGTCDGYGKVKRYKILTVTWQNHGTDFVSDAGNMPNEKIHTAKGLELLRNTAPTLQPITNAPDAFVNAASVKLLARHKTSFPNELIIRQRHVLRAVPFTRVTYEWNGRDGEFYVYGTDRKVYFEDYPQSCCCCTCC